MFSLVLAWNSNFLSYQFCSLLLRQHSGPFGDHLLGCGHGPMKIREHDALCDVIFHALLQDNSGCKREQHCGSNLDRPGDVFHPDYLFGKPAYFDVTVCNPLQDSPLSQSADLAGVAASLGEVKKDAHYEEAVCDAGGFSSLWLWRLWAFALLLVFKFLGILLSGQQTEVVWALLWPAVIF